MDRERIERAKARLRRVSITRQSRNGQVRVILASRTEPPTLAEKLAHMAEVFSAGQIDRDYLRGGFSRYMRHAR
jgi:hypothetical protein